MKGLKLNGYDVLGFNDSLLALQHFEADGNSCDVLISDIRMPAMNGFQLVKKVKPPLHPKTKILLMSSFEITKHEFDVVMPNMHVDGLICKPFQIPKLVETLNKPEFYVRY